ncbi:ABC transporter ATP-binding protein [Rhizobium calliandrae]|uniref:ABC transporter ATP-binding protein n=1 Tax=Rhizobium calliandrae TaxID=1312182 RepID=A0ABT7KGM2_9HYPH|nr:ABC transporter ATP-binding protein [Rhizobium calliandrae]MDL2407776.1 ABC transporter ATP-binding protein [Rhizobium calliandrae]
MSESPNLLEINNLGCDFSIRERLGWRRRVLRAVDRVDLTISNGDIFGIVGETGSGKTTLGKAIAGIQRPTRGAVRLSGKVVSSVDIRLPKSVSAQMQYVYQDPGASLDPRWTLRRSLHEPLVIHSPRSSASDRENSVRKMVTAMGLSPGLLDRFPHEVSGGQLRRMGLARVLVLAPKIVIFDEPTAGLDVLVQATVLGLMRDLLDQFKLTYILISHDIAVVSSICNRLAVMYGGNLVEIGPTTQVLKEPLHPYTRSLLASSLQIGGSRLTDSLEPLNTTAPRGTR